MPRISGLRRPEPAEMIAAVARGTGLGLALLGMLATGMVIGHRAALETAGAQPPVSAPLPSPGDVLAQAPVAPGSAPAAEALPADRIPETEAEQIVREARERFAPADPEAWAAERWGYVPRATGAVPLVMDSEIEYADARGVLAVSARGEVTVNGQPVVLSGLEIPGPGAICRDSAGADYDCHGWAMQGMKDWMDGREAVCATSRIGEATYGTCEMLTGDGSAAVDIGSWMVSSGLAVARDIPARSIYRDTEEMARNEARGLWSGSFSFSGRTWKP